MTKIAILGAGGKMGCRLIDNLRKSPAQHQLFLVEVGNAGRQRIAERGLATTPESQALLEAEVVILALPDRLLGAIARTVVPQAKPGTIFITLDPAAGRAGELPQRDDVSYFVTHPCHPNVFDHF